jgi:hypothetical protein
MSIILSHGLLHNCNGGLDGFVGVWAGGAGGKLFVNPIHDIYNGGQVGCIS